MNEEVKNILLEKIPIWLKNLPEDLSYLMNLIETQDLEHDAKIALVTGLNYLFKTIDLIPDGLDEIGYIDDCIILRIVSREVVDKYGDRLNDEVFGRLKIMAGDVDILKPELGEELWSKLLNYVEELKEMPSKGRTSEDILKDKNTFNQFKTELMTFVDSYEGKVESIDEKTLVKLKAFLEAKLS